MEQTSAPSDEKNNIEDSTSDNCFSRSFDTRKIMLAHRRRRLNSVPTMFVQTDDEMETQNTKLNTREWKSLNVSVETASDIIERVSIKECDNTTVIHKRAISSDGRDNTLHKSATSFDERDNMPHKSTTSPDRRNMPHKRTISSDERDNMPHKSTTSSDGHDMSHKTTTSYDGRDMPHKSTISFDGRDMPHKSTTLYEGRDMPYKSKTSFDGRDMPHKSATSLNFDGRDMPHKSTTSSDGHDMSHKTTTSYDGRDMPHKSTTSYEGRDTILHKRNTRHENIYRGLLRSLLHPLGAPDSTVGLRPGDLLDHLRDVFDVERDDHESYILEEMPNRPKNMQVNVVILEANGLRGVDLSQDTCDCYCLLMLHHPARGRISGHASPKCLTPKVSPKNTPRLSPKNYQRMSPATTPPSSPRLHPRNPAKLQPAHQSTSKGSLDSDIHSTSTINKSSHPKWNEEFTLDVEDYLTDEIHIYVCDQSKQQDVKQEKHSSLKSFLSMLRHSQDSEDDVLGCVGKITIPVRDISALGTDEWYDILAITPKGKSIAIGKCHLKLGICNKQEFYENFSSEDYYQAYKQFLLYTCKNSEKNPSRHIGDAYGSLSLKDHRILKMFAEAHRIPKISQAIVNVICLLELKCEDGFVDENEANPHIALDNLRMTWATMQIGQKNLLDRMPLTDIEISNYRKVATKYIQMKSNVTSELPELFPPTIENLNIIKAKLGVIVQLLGLDLWEAKCAPQNEISEKITKQLQENANTWIEQELKKIEEKSVEIKDKVLSEMDRLIGLVESVCSHLTVLPVLRQFYNSLSVNYYRISSLAVERKVSMMCISTMEKMNKYKKRYNSYAVNIMMACKLSLRLYSTLRKLYSVIRDNASRRDLFRLSVFHYQEWFEESMVYWLQTFRTECIHRMEKALEIDKDVVVVTSLLKYSHSSVDVLSCFSQVIGEWKKIDIRDPDCALMGVTNITDIICDGARLYADKVQSILEKNRYYDDKLNSEFDVNDRLCITLNNIEHVRMYLSELPNLLAWDNVVMMMSARYDNDNIGTQAGATLHRLIDTANEEILLKSGILLRQICEKMRVDIERYTEIFTMKEPKKVSSVDQFLGYVANNLQTLNSQLMPDIYPYMNQQLWDVILRTLDKQLLLGEQTDYYMQMKQHLRSVGSFFLRVGLDAKTLQSELYNHFKLRLELNANQSHDLMCMYYNQLATDMVTPPECYGHLAFKAAYMEETRGNINIYISVLRGTDLPGLDPNGFSDPYVEVSLQPHGMFGFSATQKTHVVKQTLNPVFNVTFQFPNVPKDYLNKAGTCILLSVFDHDRIGRDDFAGEIVVHIPSILKLGMDKSMDKMPAVIMPLKRPSKPTEGPFNILANREWDKEAKKFVSDRLRFIDHQPERTDKNKSEGGGFFSNLFANLS